MILNEIMPQTETFGMLGEKTFGIADAGMIFGILRSKLYSNPILAICREVSCNARDTHREVGKFDKAIEITLPTGLDPNYRIKDWGLGISVDRMQNVITNYAASTKRGDNIQTGAMGLGFKVPWSITDTFSVITNHNSIQYHYTCYIDETRVGKCALMNQSHTNLPNGTEIIIPIKPTDFHLFAQYTEQACRHWEVKPIIKNGNITWTEHKPIIQGDKWSVSCVSGSYNREAKLIIDGIEYPLDLSALKKYANVKLIDALADSTCLLMYFSTGELSLSANREQVFLDKPTQDKIGERLEQVIQENKGLVEQKIEAFPNLWDANLYYRQQLKGAFYNIGFLGKLQWQGIPLSDGHHTLKCPVIVFSKGRYTRKLGNQPDKIIRTIGTTLSFREDAQLWVSEINALPTPRHLKKAFEDPAVKTITVVCPNDKQTEDDLNIAIHLDKMAPKRLSSIAKVSAKSGRTSTPIGKRLLIFKLGEQREFRQVSYEAMETDTKSKIICLLKRDAYHSNQSPLRISILPSNGNVVSSSVLSSIAKRFPDFSFYGVDQDTTPARLKEEFSDCQQLEDFLTQTVIGTNSPDYYLQHKLASRHLHYLSSWQTKYHDKFKSLIKNASSPFLSRGELYTKIEALGKKKCDLDIYQAIKGEITETMIEDFIAKHPDWDFDKITETCTEKYPLLAGVDHYDAERQIAHIAAYINMADKH